MVSHQQLVTRLRQLEEIYREPGFSRDPVDIADDLTHARLDPPGVFQENVAFMDEVE